MKGNETNRVIFASRRLVAAAAAPFRGNSVPRQYDESQTVQFSTTWIYQKKTFGTYCKIYLHRIGHLIHVVAEISLTKTM